MLPNAEEAITGIDLSQGQGSLARLAAEAVPIEAILERKPPGVDAGRAKAISTRELIAWAQSGVMALTGWPGQAPSVITAPGAGRLSILTAELRHRTRALGREVVLDWGRVVSGRAALLGFTRHGRISPNGSCRLLHGRDGWVAFNLPRPRDREMVAALLGEVPPDDPWPTLEAACASWATDAFVSRARFLGLPVSRLSRPGVGTTPWLTTAPWTPLPSPSTLGHLLVVDLSAMWAGPMTAAILGAAGAGVIKIESPSRPDGARAHPRFFDWLHSVDQKVVEVEFSRHDAPARLRKILASADVVIEASRPRVLEQLGVGPGQLPTRTGRVWLSITGYGRQAPGRDWLAFGDDAAVAGGLVAWDVDGSPVFCGDAIADPVTGLFGAVAVLRALAAGGGRLIDLSMASAAAFLANTPTWGEPPIGVTVQPSTLGGWELVADGIRAIVREPIPYSGTIGVPS